MIDFEKLERAEARHESYDYLVADRLLTPADSRLLVSEFPALPVSGLLPASTLLLSPALCTLATELRGERMTRFLSRQFGIDLTGAATMLTLRCRCAGRDGRIHTDSENKIATLLFYLNPHWTEKAGRLRILTSGESLHRYAAEVAPEAGTLVAFKRSDKSWHGHEPFEGVRRTMMVNWMQSEAVARRETWRHAVAAKLKGAGF